MKAKDAAARAGVSVKALRYYERIGLIAPARLPNGYRTFTPTDLELIQQVTTLTRLGLSVRGTRPFIECLKQGHVHGDECPESLAAYHQEIARLDAVVRELSQRRDMLSARLTEAASRGFGEDDPAKQTRRRVKTYGLPKNLPPPADDGGAAHLAGLMLPDIPLLSTDGREVGLRSNHSARMNARWVIFVYPMTGVPGEDMPRGWNEIPGARGCTAEACGFRDNFPALLDAGIGAVYGLSMQESKYQRELARRLRLPYPLLSDPDFLLQKALNLPVFEADGIQFYRRLTLVIRGRTIEHVFYPVFPPNGHAQQVAEWLHQNPAAA